MPFSFLEKLKVKGEQPLDVTGRRDALDATRTKRKLNKHRLSCTIYLFFCSLEDKTRSRSFDLLHTTFVYC